MRHYRKKLEKPLSKEDKIRKGFGRLRRQQRVYGDPNLHSRRAIDALNTSSNLFEARRVYHRILTNIFTNPLKHLRDLAISTFGRLGSVREARAVFDSMPRPTVNTHRCLFMSYALNGHLPDARQIFLRMRDVDSDWWVEMMSAYARFGYVSEAKEIFDWMPQRGDSAKSLLLAAYARAGHIPEAEAVLKSVSTNPDSEVLDEMLAAYGKVGKVKRLTRLFHRMKPRSCWSWESLLRAHAVRGDMVGFRSIFELLPMFTLPAWTSMILVCGKCGMVDEAVDVFDGMPERYVESCNALLAAFALNGKLKRASRLFNEMMHLRDRDSWGTMMEACRRYGRARQGLWIFHSMNLYGLQPEPLMFLLVLRACKELEMVEEGRSYFLSMSSDHGYVPEAEHYYALAQLLGSCSKRLDDAVELLESMPFQVPASLWKRMLDVCGTRGDAERAARVVEEIFNLEGDASVYLTLARIYFRSGKVGAAVNLLVEKGLCDGTDDSALKLVVGGS